MNKIYRFEYEGKQFEAMRYTDHCDLDELIEFGNGILELSKGKKKSDPYKVLYLGMLSGNKYELDYDVYFLKDEKGIPRIVNTKEELVKMINSNIDKDLNIRLAEKEEKKEKLNTRLEELYNIKESLVDSYNNILKLIKEEEVRGDE